MMASLVFFFFSSRRRHTRYWRDWSSDVCSSDLLGLLGRDRPEVPDLGAELVHQVDVRVEAQVAGALDHELALGLAELGLELVHAVPQRAVLRVGRPGQIGRAHV